MEQIFIRLLNLSISACWLITAVLLFRLLLKKAPRRIHCILWGLVGLRLILPFSIKSIFSLIPSAETIPENIIYAQSPVIHSGFPMLNTVVNPIISKSLAPDPAASANPLQIIGFIASIIWLCGVAAILCYALISTLRLRHRLRSAVRLQDNIFGSGAISTPFVLGIFRPRIYLPRSVSKEDQACIIAHETAHIRRGDHITKPLGFLILALHWFNPLVWLSYALLSRDIELACDECVAEQLTYTEKQAYSTALLNCSIRRNKFSAHPLAFGETNVKKRIRNVMNYKKPPFWIIVSSVILCAILAVCFLTDPVSIQTLAPIGGEYGVESVVYSNGSFSYVLTPENAPLFHISEDMELTQVGMPPYGIMQETILTKENFDACFDNSDVWNDPDKFYERQSPAKLRRNNAKAWSIARDDEIFTLLQQKDGSLYLSWGASVYRPFVMHILRLTPLSTSFVGGADSPTSIIVTQKSNEVTYRYHGNDAPIPPAVTLYLDSGEFGFSYSAFSSYYPYGIYIQNDEELILRTNDEQNTYVFRINEENLIFDAKRSSLIPDYAELPDGAIFEKE
ncbi:MAG: hypothetical protein IKK29_01275 [Christensenellaceae bacterium]|nr:hypothetical protein [Christensenellaceae bacterium]